MADNSRVHVPLRLSIGGALQPEGNHTVLSFSRSLGGMRVDQAIVAIELARSGTQTYISNGAARPGTMERALEIFHKGQRLFWGVIEDSSFAIGLDPDHVEIIASIQPWHFGPPITAAQYISVEIDRRTNRPNFRVVKANEPIVFNGFVNSDDEQHHALSSLALTTNKSGALKVNALKRDSQTTRGECFMLVPPEGLQTSSGVTRYGYYMTRDIDRDRWTVRDAAEYLCVLGNEESRITNPGEAELSVLPTTILPRTELAVGRYLTDMLDELLSPYGCKWYIDPLGNGKPKIKFVRRGVGPAVSARFAKVGAADDFATTNIDAAEINYSISSLVNEVHLIGGNLEQEGTFELYRVSENKWALNEAGDYQISEFPQHHEEGTDEAQLADSQVVVPKLEDLFPNLGSKVLRKRRRFYPTITKIGALESGDEKTETRPIGPNNGYDIEVFNIPKESEGVPDDDQWINIDRIPDSMFRHVRVLEDECAIVFDRGREPDENDALEAEDEASNGFWLALGDKARMRITATIRGDAAIERIVTRDATSVAQTRHTFVWRDEKRWPWRERLESGRYASKYAGIVLSGLGSRSTQTPGPEIEMEALGKRVLEGADAARLSGTIVFNNFDETVILGGIVTGVVGRNITFQARNVRDRTPLYPQIAAITYQAETAQIVATLDYEPRSALEAFG